MLTAMVWVFWILGDCALASLRPPRRMNGDPVHPIVAKSRNLMMSVAVLALAVLATVYLNGGV